LRGARTAALALALITVGAAGGRAQDALSLTIVDYGIYKYRRDTQPNPNWEVRPLQSICHVTTTQRVPTDDGFQFGFRFQLDGPKKGTVVSLLQTISWPDTTKQTYRPTRIGGTNYIGWTNRHSKPDTWTFQLAAGDRTLSSIAFSLVDGIGVEGEPDENSTCFQTSSRDIAKWPKLAVQRTLLAGVLQAGGSS
jgi:Domain of unknown function (DUF3859)